MSIAPHAFVLAAPGTNCEHETKYAFEYVGGKADVIQIESWRRGDVSLDDSQVLILPGGFSHGDDIASGRLVGLEMRTRFAEELNRFAAAGKAVIGICNGFQILIESGLLPDGQIYPSRNKSLSLVNNSNNKYEWGWGNIKINDSVCKFIGEELVGSIIELPYAHQEGRLATNDSYLIDDLKSSGQIVFNFVDENGEPTESYPDNPNGSPDGITGICDENGNILGLMPHPERALQLTQLCNWRRLGDHKPFGETFFRSILDYSITL